MPELPEVEVITRGLRPHIVGKKITSIWYSGKKLRIPLYLEDFERSIIDDGIVEVTRRAKYVQIGMSSGCLLVIHLGMTGNLGIFDTTSPRSKHAHLEWTLDDGHSLRFNDTRRFGSVQLLSKEDADNREEKFFQNTGPEPLGPIFSPSYLMDLAKRRQLTIKQFIMNKEVVAGIGNIYANESLFSAGLSPLRKANSLSEAECTRLIGAIRQVLEHAIACGGSTISDFLNVGQERGYFQMNFKVYGKAGAKCSACSAVIEKTILGGRASFYCPQCQK